MLGPRRTFHLISVSMLDIRWKDVRGLVRFEDAFDELGERGMRRVGNRAVNRTGDMARTQVRLTLPKQTGLPRRTIVKAVRVKRSTMATLAYTMKAQGGDVSLKYFKARETRAGVSAAPFGKRQVFEGTFMRGGRFPNRVPLNMGGHVFARVGAARLPIEKQPSGVIIPVEMVSGQTAEIFNRTVARVLPRRIAHEITRATGGVLS